MGNLVTQTLGRMAGNVVQSVISALIVFTITTYVIVDLRNRDAKREATADSAKQMLIVPALPAEPGGRSVETDERVRSGLQKSGMDGKNKTGGRASQYVATGKDSLSQSPLKAQSNPRASTAREALEPSRELATGKSKSSQGAVLTPAVSPTVEGTEKVTEEKNQETEGKPQNEALNQTRAKADTAAKQKTSKTVKKRADDVFDELDKELKDLE